MIQKRVVRLEKYDVEPKKRKIEVDAAEDEDKKRDFKLSMFEGSCSVCLEKIMHEGGCRLVQLPCGHALHGQCFDNQCKIVMDGFKAIKAHAAGSTSECLMLKCNECRLTLPFESPVYASNVQNKLKEIKKFINATVLRNVGEPAVALGTPVEVAAYCASIKKTPYAILSSDSDFKIVGCSEYNCRPGCYIVPRKSECQGGAVSECYHCARNKTWSVNVIGTACDNCGVAFERNGGCSHMTCANCLYEFCYVCGGSYVGYSNIQDHVSSVLSVPFCELPDESKKNIQGVPFAFGKCACVIRQTLEETSLIPRSEQKKMCIAPSFGYMPGFGYEKLKKYI